MNIINHHANIKTMEEKAEQKSTNKYVRTKTKFYAAFCSVLIFS